ncbi:hypothetical protein [Saccharicrinis sp. FJH54]|uniref:hypothetical protein n=1 Tax=Saccharicrinis sp. FJH54 TaxID=3344665 RepID=UPI0035D510D7
MKKQHNIHKNRLTWQILRDYLSNSLSSGEMHDIEKKVMHDPFSTDAFEGMENFAPASIDNDLSNLKTRLNRKSGYDSDKKQVSYGLLIRAAAVLLLVIAASGVVIYITRSSDQLIPAKVAQDAQRKTQQEPTPLFNTESDSAQSDKISETEEKEATETLSDQPVQNATRTVRKPVEKEMEQLQPKSATSTLNMNETGKSTVENILNQSNSGNITTVQTETGAIKPEKAEAAVSVQTLEPEDEVSEALTMNATEAKMDSDKSKKATELNERTLQSAVAAKPPVEMNQYKGAIFRKIMEEEPDAIGEFEVWFNVNEDGKLSDFEVTKSINKKTDRKIIRELKNSGNWTPAYISSKPTTTRASIQLIF